MSVLNTLRLQGEDPIAWLQRKLLHQHPTLFG
jgi:hypothetical protein